MGTDRRRGFEAWAKAHGDPAVRAHDRRAIAVEQRAMTFEFSSVEEYLQIVSEVAGWTRRIDALSAAERARLGEVVAEAAAPYCFDGRVRVASAVHCAVAQK